MTFVATRCVFWALSASNNIHCIPNSAGELQHSSKAPSWWGGWWGVLSPYSLGRSCLTSTPKTNSFLCPWVLWAIEITAKGSASKKSLKNTGLMFASAGIWLRLSKLRVFSFVRHQAKLGLWEQKRLCCLSELTRKCCMIFVWISQYSNIILLIHLYRAQWMDPVNVPAKFEVRSFTLSRDRV